MKKTLIEVWGSCLEGLNKPYFENKLIQHIQKI